MDPEFVRVTSRVVAIGTIVIVLGTVALWIAFRRYGATEDQQDFRPLLFLIGAAMFILLCCLVLLRWSFAVR